MKNTKIINRLIDYYLEGSELTQDEHNTVRSLKEEMQAINYTRCCEQLKDKYTESFEVFYKDYLSKPNQGLADLYGNKITDKDYLFKRWNEDLDTLIV